MSPVVTPCPQRAEALGIKRYGFHGISYASLTARLPGIIGGALPGRVLALHLGNGASICAIRDGRSVATSMGYSPLEGLTMGTRTGGIDGNAVLRLAQVFGIDETSRILNRESGLLGLGGASDMRALHRLIAAMGGLDAVCFTGGIGENDAAVRGASLKGLGFAGVVFDAGANAAGAGMLHPAGADVAVWIVAAEEERQIAMEAMQVMAGGA